MKKRLQTPLLFILVIFAQSGVCRVYAEEQGEVPSEEESMSVEEFMQRLSSVRKVLNRRDPFEQNQPSYVKEVVTQTAIGEAKADLNSDELPPLERYPVEAYTVKMILVGDRYPRALLQIPRGGRAIVEEKMRLGDKNGIIEKIDRNGLTVKEKIRNNFGSYDDVVQRLPVGVAKAVEGN
jgi:Tfp pilus assembly protein PilP